MPGELTLEQWAWLAGAVAIRVLWQGAVIGLLAACALALLRRATPFARYAAGCTALGAFALILPFNLAYGPTPPPNFATPEFSPAPTVFEMTAGGFATPQDSATAAPSAAPSPPPAAAVIPWRGERPRPVVAAWYEAALPWIGGSWAAGAFLFALYDIVGLLAVARMRRRGAPASAELVALARRVRQRIGVYSEVPVRVVEGISTAMVTGLFRVVILVPVSMVSGMSPDAVEAILAHEFAHLRRWDRWINLIQCLLETILFFHPALWWLSRRIRTERELCCDEMALQICPDRALYVRALLSLSDTSTPLPAVALSSHGGSFAHRVRHILDLPQRPVPMGRTGGSLGLLGAIAFAACLLLWNRASSASDRTGASLRFSDLRPLGTVQARWEDDIRPHETPWLTDYTAGWTVLDEARGDVKIPRGAQVKLSITKTDLSDLRELPPDAIYFLDARYRDLTDGDLTPIAHLTGLRALDLGENLYNLHGPGLAALGALRNLEWLNIHGSPLESLPENAIRQFPNLRYLTGIFRQNSGRALREAADLDKLEFLSMKTGAPISAEDVGHLAGKTSLRGLALYNMGLTDEMLAALQNLPHLEYLNVSENPIGDSALVTIGQMTELRFLDLHRTAVTDAGVARLADLTKLEFIELANTEVTGDSIASLEKMPSLFAVNFLDTRVTEARASEFIRGIADRGRAVAPVQRSSNPDAPRIGILMSHYTRSGPVAQGYEYDHYTYGNQECLSLANSLNEANFEVFAVVEPGTEHLGDLPLVLRSAGLASKVIEGTNEAELLQLDAVLTCSVHNLPPEVLETLGRAVEAGVGLVSVGPLGDNLPGAYDPLVTALTGIDDGTIMDLGCQDVAVTVHQPHPLLGAQKTGASYYVRMSTSSSSASGVVGGTALLDGPVEYMKGIPALYARDFGEGRIVRAQWQQPMQPGLPFPGHTFYVRALNWVAYRDVDAVW